MKMLKRRGAHKRAALKAATKARKAARRVESPTTSLPKAKTASPHAAMFAAWKAGGSIRDLVVTYTLTRSQCRKHLTALAGGKDAFKALRAEGAGGSVEAFGGQRATPRTKEVVAQNDAKARQLKATDTRVRIDAKSLAHSQRLVAELTPRVASERGRRALVLATSLANAVRFVKSAAKLATWKGWWSELIPTETSYVLSLTSPTGERYVPAGATERADVVLNFDDGVTTRFKAARDASLAKRERAAAKDVARGEAAIERTRAAKRERKAAKKAAATKATKKSPSQRRARS